MADLKVNIQEANRFKAQLETLNKETEKILKETSSKLKEIDNYASGPVINACNDVSEWINDALTDWIKGAGDFFVDFKDYITKMSRKVIEATEDVKNVKAKRR